MNNKERNIYHSDEINRNNQAILSEGTPEQKAIIKRVSSTTDWYHSIDLGHGIVTPGYFDHRPDLHLYRLPANVEGKRVLDVATFDGFWAFEFEKRGATEVIAMDIGTLNERDMPPGIRAQSSKETLMKETGTGFHIASDILGSKVKRKILNVYDLSPEKVGMFDIVFCSDLLLHLMNPVRALQNIRSVVSGYAYIVDIYGPELGENDGSTVIEYLGAQKKLTWWRFSLGSMKQMILDAGFSRVELVNKFKFNIRGAKMEFWHAVFKAYP
jgi:tRNA (mo5U34)-methyltransferase